MYVYIYIYTQLDPTPEMRCAGVREQTNSFERSRALWADRLSKHQPHLPTKIIPTKIA